MKPPLQTHAQADAYASPWPAGRRLAMAAWALAWPLLCGWTPKPLSPWRVLVLRGFGARVSGRPFVHSRARIHSPWNLTLRDRACLGDGANAYALGPIELGEEATVAQEAYLCTGTHDFSRDNLPLQTAPIRVGRRAFVGARAFVLPGVTIGAGAVVGACAVVTRDVEPDAVVAGNPARVIGRRGGD